MDMWRTLLITTFGFILTGIVGTWITYFWQTRNWRHQQEYIRNKELVGKQIDIVENISNLIGRRRYRMFRAVAALRARDPDRVEKAWREYDNLVIEWNDNVNAYITKLRQFFSRSLQYELDSYINGEFSAIGSKLEEVKRRFDFGKIDEEYFDRLKEISGSLNLFNGYSNDFTGSLWSHIDALKDKIHGRPKINPENIDELSLFYLLKNVFVLRK